MGMQARMVSKRLSRINPVLNSPRMNCRMLQQAGEQALIALQAQQDAILHRPQQLAASFFTGSAVRNDLAKHRVIERD
jgi:hypothetical protein